LSLQSSFFDGGKESRMVAFGLVGIHLGKRGDRLVEGILVAR
jgi:hypothetical protein